MSVNWPLVVQVGSPILALFAGALLNHLLERRERVIAHLGHISSFKLTQNEIPAATVQEAQEGAVVASQTSELQTHPEETPTGSWVYTHSVIVRNTGSKTATNIRLGHNILPHVTINPDIDYSIRDLPGGGKEIVIPRLVPKKEVTVSYLYFPPITWDRINTYLETDNGPIKVVQVLLQIQPPKWLLRIIWVVLIIGLIGIAYSMAEIISALTT